MGKSVFGSKNKLTYTEIHSAMLGVIIGVMSGYGHGIGYTNVAFGVSLVFLGIALGIYRRGTLPKAQRTIRHEPWYALAAFLFGAAIMML